MKRLIAILLLAGWIFWTEYRVREIQLSLHVLMDVIEELVDNALLNDKLDRLQEEQANADTLRF